MADPLLRYKDFKLTEAYSLERIVEVVKNEKQYRIEVFKSMSNENAQYHAHVYREADSEGGCNHVGESGQ
jgi:isopropylmalate/homocitrate/citramalate synthase